MLHSPRTLVALFALALAGCVDFVDPAPGAASGTASVPTATATVADPTAFTLPPASAAARAAIVGKYAALDPTNVIPRGLLEDAIVYYDLNKALIPQSAYIVVVDLSQYSGKNRFWLVNLATGAVEAHKVAHGAGSDPNNDGYATAFSNVPGSNESSLGFYLSGELYDGDHPHSMRLDGLSSTGSPNGMANTNVRERAVVMHEADYVSDSNADQQGRSDGCLALDPDIELAMVDRIHDGTLIYVETKPLNPPVGRAPCGTIAASGATVIDNGDACFTGGGPAATLRSVTTAGYNDNLLWTHATADATEQNFGEWTLDFAQAGNYTVEVYTAAAFAQSKQASYLVEAGASTQAVEIDQTAVDGFQSLGTFAFAAGPGQSVHLGDNTGEASGTVQLVFDAVRVTRVE
jgi:hypothetical protein